MVVNIVQLHYNISTPCASFKLALECEYVCMCTRRCVLDEFTKINLINELKSANFFQNLFKINII